jgi:hypothetical protein
MVKPVWIGDFDSRDIIYLLIEIQKRYLETRFFVNSPKSGRQSESGLFCDHYLDEYHDTLIELLDEKRENIEKSVFKDLLQDCELMTHYKCTSVLT